FTSLCTPVARIDGLSLGPHEKQELAGLADAYRRLDAEGCGLSLVVDCTDLETGIEAAEAIAERAWLKIKKLRLNNVFSDAGTKITDPVSQREVTKKEFAFMQSTGHRAATVFIDDRGLFGKYLSGDKDSNGFVEELLSRLRSFNGLFVLVTKSIGGVKGHKLPPEFSYCAELRYPPEDTQIKRWEGHIDGTHLEGELIDLVEKYPMHIKEIDFIARQARIRSHLREQGDGVSIGLLKEVVAEYRQVTKTPLLFGRRGSAHEGGKASECHVLHPEGARRP
ncbi:MAG: hypothetical protein NUW09_06165, partial [Deltaproteobacteria bacterium]|nr:hypothetical protein [Deltaproteobacteria bacterium]